MSGDSKLAASWQPDRRYWPCKAIPYKKLGDACRVASIKKDTEEKNSFGRVRRESSGLNKLAKQLDGGAAVCSGPRSGLRSLGRLVQ